MFFRAIFSTILLLFSFTSAHAYSFETSNEIASLIEEAVEYSPVFSERLEFISGALISRPYLLGPLGEGPTGRFDQDPLYRSDKFDCTTFVETTIAMAQSQNFDDFKNFINRIRYKDSKPLYVFRNHFVEIDWNPNNIAAGFFRDITFEVGASFQHFVVPQVFNKQLWYQSKTVQDLQVTGLSETELQQRLDEMHHMGDQFVEQSSALPIVATQSLADLLPQLHAPAVLNIVKQLATAPAGMPNTMVTHQVLVIKKDHELRIRQASSRTGVMKIIDTNVSEFLSSPLITNPNTRGLNILSVLDMSSGVH